MGAFVFMLGQLALDVMRWFIFFSFGVVAFACGLFVLFHNQRAAVGPPYGALEEECDRIHRKFASVGEGMLFLLEITLEPGGLWTCFRQSSA